MATKDQEQAYKLQGDFISRAMESVKTLREGKPQRVDAIVKEGTERLNIAKVRLESAKQDRDDMLRRMDERIARFTDDVTRLEAGVDALRSEVTEEAPKPTRGKRRAEPS
jgi:L-lactate utilization protein LutB